MLQTGIFQNLNLLLCDGHRRILIIQAPQALHQAPSSMQKTCMSQAPDTAVPPNSLESLQHMADSVASLLSKDRQEALERLQDSAYGQQQNPAPLPATDQARCLPVATAFQDMW